MFKRREYPILEFDSCRKALIEPKELVKTIDIAEYCVITFFREIIEQKKNNDELIQVGSIHSETLDIPIYETLYNGKRVAIVLGFIGSSGSAGLLEELIALGCKKFMVCGGAGILVKDIKIGNLILPTSAIRDEGVSYHYLEPSREVRCNTKVIAVIEKVLNSKGITYLKGKTWTTDGFYRETKDKLAFRISEGCVTVEMEAAAFFAVAEFREVLLGQILYSGDDLSGEQWDCREWNSRKDIREVLVDTSIEICLNL